MACLLVSVLEMEGQTGNLTFLAVLNQLYLVSLSCVVALRAAGTFSWAHSVGFWEIPFLTVPG